MTKPEGFFKNGDQWYGDEIREGNVRFFLAVDKTGDVYETQEMPTRYPLFTMIRVDNGISESAAIAQISAIRQSI